MADEIHTRGICKACDDAIEAMPPAAPRSAASEPLFGTHIREAIDVLRGNVSSGTLTSGAMPDVSVSAPVVDGERREDANRADAIAMVHGELSDAIAAHEAGEDQNPDRLRLRATQIVDAILAARSPSQGDTK